MAPLLDEEVWREVGAGVSGIDAMLHGHRTYDIFAGYWPDQEGGVDGGIARLFNSVPKVRRIARHLDLRWADSRQLDPDLVTAVREMRAARRGPRRGEP